MDDFIQIRKNTQSEIVIKNTQPLKSYPANIGSLLRKNSERFPLKGFLFQRAPQWNVMTYKEARERVDRLSEGLLSLGANEQTPLAILSANSIAMALLQIAAIQIGVPVVPISYVYLKRNARSQIEHILEISQARWIFLSEINGALSWLPKEKCFFMGEKSVAGLPSVWSLMGTKRRVALREERFQQVTSQTLAKIQFTSGSTNFPKGVEVTHGMMLSNQMGAHQMWPFLSSDMRAVDWLPWHHTFGGNFVFNMILFHGGSLYIDDGRPAPGEFTKTLRNLKEISPSVYFSVPLGYTLLYRALEKDQQLRESFFQNMRFLFNAAAALDQKTYEKLKQMGKQITGRNLPFLAGWGCTETSPDATLVFKETQDSRNIGLPIPGVTIKLSPTPSGKKELRVKGPNVTRGYYRQPEMTAASFDAQGYYQTGDAGEFWDSNYPKQGLIFNGRIKEDFKLASGTWIKNSYLRGNIQRLGHPWVVDLVVAAPNKEYLTALVFPNLEALKEQFFEISQKVVKEEDFLDHPEIQQLFRNVFRQHNSQNPGNSKQFARILLMAKPPSIYKNETSDKGYLNQLMILENNPDLLELLYAEPAPNPRVIVIEPQS